MPIKRTSIFYFALLGIIFYHSQTHAADVSSKKSENIAIAYPKITYGSGNNKKLLMRGEYLTKMGNCAGCHTDKNHHGPVFGGGSAVKTRFGTFYSPNITSDKETGIGNWTDDQFIRAMQNGVSPEGHNYFPVFPYTSFTRVNSDDLLAIKAYLMHVPAVKKVPPKNDVPFPFRWRFLQYGWKLWEAYQT